MPYGVVPPERLQEIIFARVPKSLADKVTDAAKSSGVTTSEFIRQVLTNILTPDASRQAAEIKSDNG